MNAHIDYSPAFEHWQAMVAANATLDEIYKWEQGGYPPWFMARTLAWYRGKVQVESHQQDAVSRAMKSKTRKR